MNLPAPVVFYLEHEAQIQEWYHLKDLVTQKANEFFLSLEGALRNLLTKELSGRPLLHADKSASWPCFSIYREAWYDPEHDCPLIGVAIAWPRASATFFDACTGLYLSSESSRRGKIRKRLLDAVADRPLLRKRWPKHNDLWPLFRYERPEDEDYWHNLDKFRWEIIDAVRILWEQSSESVDQALSG